MQNYFMYQLHLDIVHYVFCVILTAVYYLVTVSNCNCLTFYKQKHLPSQKSWNIEQVKVSKFCEILHAY